MSNALRTPRLSDPSFVMQAVANFGDPADLVPLGITVDVSTRGWVIMMRSTRKTQPVIAALCAALALKEAALERISDSERSATGVRTLGQEMLSHIIHRDWVNEGDAVARQGEKIIATRHMGNEALATLLDKINVHATNCRAANFGADMADGFTLFHLRDDPARGSTLQAFLKAYSGLEVPVLSAYHTEFGTVFLPKAPPRESLSAVAYIMDRAPELFGFAAKGATGAPSAMLFALVENDDSEEKGTHGRDICLDLRNSRFFGSQAFAEHIRPVMITAMPSADPEKGIEDLRRQLRNSKGTFAHALQLRENLDELLARDELVDLSILKSERKALDLQIRHIKASLPAQAVLIRVGDEGLDSVIHFLRGLISRNDNWEGVSYKLEQNASDPEKRRHVFHFSPELAKEISIYARLQGKADIEWFRGDQAWTQIYGAFSRIQVLVPWKTALHPLPHSWDGDQIDNYLAEMVSLWSGESIQLPSGKDHVLVFYPNSEESGSPLAVDVYMEGDFKPIKGQTITWLNAVQAQLTQASEKGETLEAEALETDAEIASIRPPKAEQIKAVLAAQEQEMLAYGRDAVVAIFDGVEKAVGDIVARMDERIGLIQELETAAKDMERKYHAASGRLSGIHRKDRQFAQRAKSETARDVREMTAFMDELEKREKASDAAIARTTKRIKAMHSNIAVMKAQLKWWSND